jgi:hypothetical protein
MCARVGNQWSRGVVTARVQTGVRSLRHQRRDLHQSNYLTSREIGTQSTIIMSALW